jgi:hypothetical protein
MCCGEPSLLLIVIPGGEEPKFDGVPLNGGKDLAQSLVYCVAVFVAVPNADMRGEAIARGDADGLRLLGLGFVLPDTKSAHVKYKSHKHRSCYRK